MDEKKVRKVVGVVGPCGSGKTSLVKRLGDLGINARHIAQEHSYVAAMWQKITHPDLLIFLDASYAETIRRRKLNWTMEEYLEQHRRLAHARQHADLYILTDVLNPEQVFQIVENFLKEHAIYPEDR
jgi:deoxyadenosine/deoxycytidine kinase